MEWLLLNDRFLLKPIVKRSALKICSPSIFRSTLQWLLLLKFSMFCKGELLNDVFSRILLFRVFFYCQQTVSGNWQPFLAIIVFIKNKNMFFSRVPLNVQTLLFFDGNDIKATSFKNNLWCKIPFQPDHLYFFYSQPALKNQFVNKKVK